MYRVLETRQIPHCRNRNSTDHLSKGEENINIPAGSIHPSIHHQKANGVCIIHAIVFAQSAQTSEIFVLASLKKQVDAFTEGSGHSQEGDLVNDCTPPHRTIMGQSGPLPYNTVHPRFLHYTVGSRTTSVLSLTENTAIQRSRPIKDFPP